ncbi:MAG TPA: hypothetical protein VN931_07545 [Fibrobacteria bacterium]|nr:hypothetical protein [Fibrobacteria bacterium]
MRTLTALLLLAGIAIAIPLRKGASLGYKVWRGWESDSTFATLTILDSTATDSGALWRVGIRDSLIGAKRIRLDTATLWVRGDTDTVWLAPSCLTAWDPSPIPMPYIDRYFSAAGACFLENGNLVSWNNSISWGFGSYNLRDELRVFGFEYVDSLRTIQPPLGAWMSDTGWGRIQDTISREDWRLTSIDGQPMSGIHFWDTTAAPTTSMNQGESWVWEVTDSSIVTGTAMQTIQASVQRIAWQVSETLPDSGSWIRRKVRSSDSTIDIRLDRATGRVVTSPSDSVAAWLSSGMLHLWSDFAIGAGETVRRRIGMISYGIQHLTDSTNFVMRIGIGLDEFINDRISENIIQQSEQKTSILLLVHNSDTLRTASLSSSRLQARTPPLTSLSSLCDALRSHPAASVRITNLSGRIHAFPASEAMTYLGNRHGVVQVEVRDGAYQANGRLFLP